MKTFTHTITDELGIHARPAGQLVNTAKKYDDTIIMRKGEKEADAKKLIQVMSLGAKMGDVIIFEIDGDTEDKTISELEKFVKENF